MKPLGELVSIIKGSKASEVFDKPKEGAYRYIQIEDLRSDDNLKFAINNAGSLAKKSDVLIAWDGANAGTASSDLEGYAGSTIAILRPLQDNIYSPYLGQFLSYKFDEIQINTTGATIPHINRNHLENLSIPLPPLPEQQRIAAILAKADRLRRLRRHARQLSSAFLQSVFLEMFGDPRTNRKGWDIVHIEDCVKPTKQITPLSLGKKEFWYVDITSIDKDTKTIIEPKLIEVKVAPSRARKNILVNDILVSTVRPNLNTVAKVQSSLDNQIASTGFCVLRANKGKVLPEYLFAFVQLTDFVDYLVKNQTGANYPAVSDGIILDTPIPLPALADQERFASVVAQVEGLRAQELESERQAEHLFQSLLQRAFHGE